MSMLMIFCATNICSQDQEHDHEQEQEKADALATEHAPTRIGIDA
jgi:hypothetical protein